MRQSFMGLMIAAVGFAFWPLVVTGEEKLEPSGRNDAKDWIDLFPGKNLKGWRRVALAPDVELNAKNPWTVDDGGKTLHCDGVGVKEMLLHDAEFKDGTFHVEFRFEKSSDRRDYNSGAYVRSAMDGKVWHQAQIAHLEKRPLLGDLFGMTPKDGTAQKFLVEGQGSKLAKPPGEWNTFEIHCKGPVVTVAVNGETATTWKECAVPRGHVGLQAEFFKIEFKNLKFKPSRR